MKNRLIAALVAAVILFVWQFLSWAALGLHQAEMQYAPNQDAVMQVLSENLEPGHYFLPQPPPGTDDKGMEAYQSEAAGKPWAMVSYHSSMDMSMGMSMIRGFVVDLLSAILLIWLLGKMQGLDLKTSVLSSLFVGLIGYLTISYLNSAWFETPSMGYLIDAVVQWGLVGLWLGWFMPGRME